MRGITISKNCMGTLPLDSPKLNKDGSITLWNPCMMQKKNILESSRNGFIVEITRTIFLQYEGKQTSKRHSQKPWFNGSALFTESFSQELPSSSSHQKVHEETAGILRRKTRPSTPSTIKTRCLQAAWLRKNKRFPAHRWWILQHNII